MTKITWNGKEYAGTYAFAAIMGDGSGTYSIGKADLGIKGYTPEPFFGTFDSYDAASTKAEAFRIVASTMFPAK